jgi:hypothetical protein
MNSDSITAEPNQRVEPAAVCTLPPASLGERLAWIRAEILPHAIHSEQRPNGIVLELQDAPGLAAKLDQLVALERACCSDIVFEHRASTGGRRTLEVRGIDPGAAVFATLQVPGAPPRLGRRLAAALGLGTLLSLIVCCALPLALVALFGAAAAAPFAFLDDPWMISGAVLLFGGIAFAMDRRRRA